MRQPIERRPAACPWPLLDIAVSTSVRLERFEKCWSTHRESVCVPAVEGGSHRTDRFQRDHSTVKSQDRTPSRTGLGDQRMQRIVWAGRPRPHDRLPAKRAEPTVGRYVATTAVKKRPSVHGLPTVSSGGTHRDTPPTRLKKKKRKKKGKVTITRRDVVCPLATLRVGASRQSHADDRPTDRPTERTAGRHHRESNAVDVSPGEIPEGTLAEPDHPRVRAWPTPPGVECRRCLAG